MITLSRQSAILLATIILIIELSITPLQIIRSSTFKQNSLASIDISAAENRFTEIKPLLPKDTLVGYIGKNNKGLYEKQYDVSKDFSVAQYALIPTILEIGIRPNTIIGDFPNEKIAQQKINDNHLRIIKNFHNGIYLLTHSNP